MERTYVFIESAFSGGVIDFWSLPGLPAGGLFGRIQSGGPTQKTDQVVIRNLLPDLSGSVIHNDRYKDTGGCFWELQLISL
jgi:hypothetical protein